MIQSSEVGRQNNSKPVLRRAYPEELKLQAVNLYKTRGSRPVSSIAEELGLTEQIIYSWARKLEETGSLASRPTGRKTGTPSKSKKAESTALAHRKPVGVLMSAQQTLQQSPTQHALTVGARQSSAPYFPTPFDHDELVILREDNRRLKAALAAALSMKLEK